MSEIIIEKKLKAIKNANVYIDGTFKKADIYVDNGKISEVCLCLNNCVENENDLYIFPGFTDVHVHLREPGFLYKETIKTGTLAAAHGGYTTICAMPNLNPVPDSMENLTVELDAIKRDALIDVLPYGAITKGEQGNELCDMEKISHNVAAFSDDGRGVQNEQMMRSAMQLAKKLNKIIAAHCEDNSLLNGGYIHKGEYAEGNNHKGISSESEYLPIKRDLELAEQTKVKYHVCHISTWQSVELIREAKKKNVDVTCETAPHYLVLNDSMLKDDGRFKMNPPIRTERDRLALIEAICDGTIDMIATDHAPHSFEEKSKGLKNSLMGVTGIETSFSILYTKLVKSGIISLEKLIELLCDNPNKRFGINKKIQKGSNAHFTVFDLNKQYTIAKKDLLSMGKCTPFEGESVYGKCVMTVYKGELVWQECLTEK